jgi:hypothetical protein
VNHSIKEYVRDDDYTKTVEGYFSIVKRGIYDIYQHVSEAHLHRYLAEFDFRCSNRTKLGIDDVARTDRAVKNPRRKSIHKGIAGDSLAGWSRACPNALPLRR